MPDDQNKTSTIDDLVNELTKKNSNNSPSPSSQPSKDPAPDSSRRSTMPVGGSAIPPNLPIGGQSQSSSKNPEQSRSQMTKSSETGGQSKSPTSQKPGPSRPEVPTRPTSPSRSDLRQDGPRFTPPPPLTGGSPRPMQKDSSTAPSSRQNQPPAPTPPTRSTSGPSVNEYQSSFRTMKEDISSVKQGQKPVGVDVPRKVQAPSSSPSPVSRKPGELPQEKQFKTPSAALGGSKRTSPLAYEKRSPTSPNLEEQKQSQVSVPPPADGFGGAFRSNRLFLMIAGIAVAFGVLYWFLVLRSPTPEIAIPSPTPTATPMLGLREIFQAEESNIVVDRNNLVESFKAAVSGLEFNETSKFLNLSVRDSGEAVISILDIVTLPQSIQDTIGSEMMIVTYGQTELFSQDGQPTTAPTEDRLAIIIEARDSAFVLQGASSWELSMTTDLMELFDFEVSKQSDPNFADNTYQGVSIRYKNFPWPDRSIDYAVVPAINGKSYLVITNSREAAFAVIDILRGRVAP